MNIGRIREEEGVFHTRICLIKIKVQLTMNLFTTRGLEDMIVQSNVVVVVETAS